MLEFQAEITGMLVFERNYWSSCRVGKQRFPTKMFCFFFETHEIDIIGIFALLKIEIKIDISDIISNSINPSLISQICIKIYLIGNYLNYLHWKLHRNSSITHLGYFEKEKLSLHVTPHY